MELLGAQATNLSRQTGVRGQQSSLGTCCLRIGNLLAKYAELKLRGAGLLHPLSAVVTVWPLAHKTARSPFPNRAVGGRMLCARAVVHETSSLFPLPLPWYVANPMHMAACAPATPLSYKPHNVATISAVAFA